MNLKKLYVRARLWVIWARMWHFTRTVSDPRKKDMCYVIGQLAAWTHNQSKKWWMPHMPYLTDPNQPKERDAL